MGNLQEILPSLLATAVFALCLVFVARQEEAYAWWKAVVIPLAGALILIGTEMLVGVVPSETLRIGIAWLSIFLVIGGVTGLARILLQMSWRDASLVGVAYAIAQAAVFFAQLYFSTNPLPFPS
jgi:hypothetical protein